MSVLGSLTVDRCAAYRTPAWQNLGNVFKNPVTDFNEMMRISTLDQLDVREEVISVSGGDANFLVPVKALVGTTVTTGERNVLGIVGEGRTLIRPDEAFGFLQNLIPGLHWEIAGTLKNDRIVFGALRWHKDSKPGNGDANLLHYLVVCFAFDGTLPLTVFVTTIRPECGNTITAGIKGAVNRFTIRQTKNARDRMTVQADTFRKANVYVSALDKAIAEMLAAPITDKQFDNLFTHFNGKAPEDNTRGRLTKYEDKREAHIAMWNADHNANIRGTAYGAWNVVCEVKEWGRQERDSDKGSEAFAMAGAGFDTETEKFRANAFARVRHVAGLDAL